MKVFICAIAFNLFLDKSFSHFHVLFVTFNNKDFFSATCLPDQVFLSFNPIRSSNLIIVVIVTNTSITIIIVTSAFKTLFAFLFLLMFVSCNSNTAN